jgi:metallo-beta-lactamase family protein
MQLTFFGGAGEVTGSCYLIETDHCRFLVDCGMFQGGRDADLKNQRFPYFDPRTIDFVLLTHAHIDHSGMLPRLAALGFQGAIHATGATNELLDVMLRDSAHIQAKEAEWEARHPQRHSSHNAPLPPLYTLADVDTSLMLLKSHLYEEAFEPTHGVQVIFHDAGHILGSAIIEIQVNGKTLVFSGDLGQPGRPILRSAHPVDHADVLLIESTYGNRLHKDLDETMEELVKTITETFQRRGNVIMPAFTVGRTQEILYLLIKLTHERRLHNLKIYVDSPLALSATEITMRHIELFNREAQALMAWSQERRKEMPDIQFIQEVEESMALNDIRSGAIIISASGMCDAGRIKHHLRYNLRRSECSIVFTGFQAMGTLGRRLVDGAKLVRIFGEEIPVRAHIHTIGGLSAHADQAGLLNWLSHFRRPPGQTFVVHGESATAIQFANLINEKPGWRARAAEAAETVSL